MKKGNIYTFAFAFAVCIFCSVALALASTNLKPQQDLSARLDVVKNILSVVGMSKEQIKEIEKKDPKELLNVFNTKFETRIVDKNNSVVTLDSLKKELVDKLGYKQEFLDIKASFEIIKIFEAKLSLLAKASNQSVEDYDQKIKLIFLYKPNTEIEAYIVPVEGMGLWDMIYGYIAIEPDLVTVKDIRFYKQAETPGLGGEISKLWFTDRFKGKRFLSVDQTFTSIGVVKGSVDVVIKDKNQHIHYVDGISGGTITGDGVTTFLKEDLGAYNTYFSTIRGKSAIKSKVKKAGSESK